MAEQPTLFEFGRVDETADPEAFVDYLDSVSRAALAYKRLSFRLLKARPGDVLLDLGCGPGDDARALAGLVGTEGRVVGIDSSEAMIAEARSRAAGCGLPVEYRIANAHSLDVSDDDFDGCRSKRVLQHLSDPRSALRELARVTRLAGRPSHA